MVAKKKERRDMVTCAALFTYNETCPNDRSLINSICPSLSPNIFPLVVVTDCYVLHNTLEMHLGFVCSGIRKLAYAMKLTPSRKRLLPWELQFRLKSAQQGSPLLTHSPFQQYLHKETFVQRGRR